MPNKALAITDASTFGTADALAAIIYHAYDAYGNVQSAKATSAGSTTNLDLSTFNFSQGLSIKATVVTEKGCTADLGFYNISTGVLQGELAYLAK